jgi:hypothetical protein
MDVNNMNRHDHDGRISFYIPSYMGYREFKENYHIEIDQKEFKKLLEDFEFSKKIKLYYLHQNSENLLCLLIEGLYKNEHSCAFAEYNPKSNDLILKNDFGEKSVYFQRDNKNKHKRKILGNRVENTHVTPYIFKKVDEIRMFDDHNRLIHQVIKARFIGNIQILYQGQEFEDTYSFIIKGIHEKKDSFVAVSYSMNRTSLELKNKLIIR